MGKVIVFGLMVWLVIHFIRKASARKRAEEELQELGSGFEVRVTVSGDRWDDDDDYDFESTQSDEECWIPSGQATEIHGHTIPKGMLFVGHGLGSIDSYGADPALINPQLSRSANRSCTTNYEMSYWPAYSRISPDARTAYIDWLAKGRRVENAYIGYVFLF